MKQSGIREAPPPRIPAKFFIRATLAKPCRSGPRAATSTFQQGDRGPRSAPTKIQGPWLITTGFSFVRRVASNLNDGIAVKRHPRIMGQQTHRLDQRLGDQNAIKRILMMQWKFLHCRSVLRFHGKETVAGFREVTQRILAGNRHITTFQSVLDGYSHTLAALTQTVERGEVISSRALEDNLGLSVMAHKATCVSSRIFNRARPP